MIKANNLTKKFGENKALDSVTFEIPEGSIYGLVGSNGSGKSTFMRLISGVYMADGGEILVDNQNPFDNSLIKSKICYLPDTPYFIHQSNLNEMMRYYKMLYKDFDIDRFEQLLKIFPLDRRARISTMSKGMQRQAALILAISTKPKYLLLDEAFDGLDPIMRKVLKSLLAEGVSDGMTAIIASHNLRDLDELCDTVGILHNGKVLLNDDIENLRGGIHKVQVVFNMVPDISVFEGLDIVNIEKSGSVVQLVCRGDEQDIKDYIGKLLPQFLEIIPPSFEEIFMYELEVNGYDAKNIIE